jgi:phosphoglycolate phosphatase
MALFHGLPPIVVFDLDGTLAETGDDIVATLNHIMRREGLEPVTMDQGRDLIGAGAKVLLQRGFTLRGVPLPEDRLSVLFKDFLDHYEAHIVDHTYLFDGVIEALDALRDDGFCLAVCTNKIERHSVKLLDIMGVGDRFATIAGRDTFAFFKPDPRHLTETIRVAGGDPKRAVMVGDSRTDIDTAKAAGIPSIAVPFGYTDTPVDQLGPTRIINHFNELKAAVQALV